MVTKTSDSKVKPRTLASTAPSAPVAGAHQGSQPWARRAAKGAGVSGLNPKALLLFLALLPQFISRGAAWPLAAQIALLGLVHIANCAVVYTGVGTAARRVLRTRPAAARAVTRFAGAAMIAIAALLLVERLLT
jgi:threonine/homoserine/homoserine lactone efflux protein